MNFGEYFILFIVILVFLAEIYKMRFESNKEAKDERGLALIYKAKSLSYSILTGGIFLALALVAVFKLLPLGGFVFIVMGAYFVQSIASSIYLYQARKV